MRCLLFSALLICYGSLEAQTEYLDSIWHNGMHRTFIVHLPPSYTTSTLFPLEIVLHGGGKGGAQKIIDEHQFEEVADTADYIAVFPNGYKNSWADGRGTTDADKDGMNDVSFLSNLIDSLSFKLAFNIDRVYLCGGSNGGFMTQRMACEASDKFAAFASIISNMSDSLAGKCSPTKAVNMLIMSSTNDQWVPYEGGEMGALSAGGTIIGVDSTIRFWLNHNQSMYAPDSTKLADINTSDNGDVDVFTYPLGIDSSEVVLYRVNGAGHTVPGQLPKWNQIPLLGYVNRDIDGAQEVWKFFKKHSIKQKTSTTKVEFNPEFEIYPNPMKDQLHITTNATSGLYTLVLRDYLGRVLTHLSGNQDNVTVNTEGYQPGIYFISFLDENGLFIRTYTLIK